MPSDLRGTAALAAAVFFAVTVEMTPAGAVGHIARSLDADVPAAAAGSALYATATAAVALPCALLSRRFDQRSAAIAVGIAFAVVGTASALAPELHSYLAFRTLNGAVHGAFFPLVLALAAGIDANRPERGVSRVLLGNACALAFGVPLSEALSSGSWRIPLAAASLGVALAVLAVPKPAPAPGRVPPDRLRTAPRPPLNVLALALAFALALAGHFAYYTFLGSFADAEGTSPSVILGVYGLAVVAGAAVAGRVARRGRMRRAAAVAAIQGAVLIPVGALGGSIALALTGLVAGLCFGLLPALIQTEMLERSDGQETVASAVAVIAFNIGIAAGAYGGGLVYPAAPGIPAVLGGILLMTASAAFLGTAVRKREPGQGPSGGTTESNSPERLEELHR